jgi:hypothetical protein
MALIGRTDAQHDAGNFTARLVVIAHAILGGLHHRYARI